MHTLWIYKLILSYADCMLDIKLKIKIIFNVISCVWRKSILSIIRQNPVKAWDFSQLNIQTSKEHKNFISKNTFECYSSHKQI